MTFDKMTLCHSRQDIQNLRLETEVLERQLMSYEQQQLSIDEGSSCCVDIQVPML
jgi:hypothetical protein